MTNSLNFNFNQLAPNSYDNFFLNEISNDNSKKIVIYGANKTGQLALCAFKKLNINVSYVMEEDDGKIGNEFFGIKILSPSDILNIDKNALIFISHPQIEKGLNTLLNLGFKNIYSCIDLWNLHNFKTQESLIFLKNLDPTHEKILGHIDYHKYNVLKYLGKLEQKLIMTNIDFVITEACSMKCVSCSNLMQYYERPKNSDVDVMFKSIDRIMECVDRLLEARVFGGDPFMNKEMYKYLYKLVDFEKIKKIIIYTNAVLLPKKINLDALINKKIKVHITDYGPHLSKKKDEVINFCKENNVSYECDVTKKWDPIGKLEKTNESSKQLSKKFKDCCVNNLFQVLHGKVYKCPFSAHGSNMNFWPADNKYDFIDLLDENIEISELKKRLFNFYHSEKYLTACKFCLGRGVLTHGEPKMEAAIQTKKFIQLQRLRN